MKACMHTRYDPSSKTKTAEMEIVDREREKEWLEQMDTILIFVCHTRFLISAELTSCPGCIIRGFLERFPDRAPSSSRTGPYGYNTGRPNLPNPDDA